MNNKRKNAVLIIILLVVLVALYFAFSKKTGPLVTSGKYSNSSYGISFSYPDNYTVQERDVATGDINRHVITLITKADQEKIFNHTAPAEGPTKITIDVFSNPKNVSLEEWIGESKDAHLESITSTIATTSLNGVLGAAYSWNGVYRANSIVLQHKTNIVMVTMTYTSLEDQIWKDFPAILQSLKFN